MPCAFLAMSAIFRSLRRFIERICRCVRNSAHCALATTTARRISPVRPGTLDKSYRPNLPVPPTDSSNNHGTAVASGATCLTTTLAFTQLPSLSCHVGPAKCRPMTEPSITTDKLGSYPKAIRRLQREGKLPQDTKHRTSKYLNNIIEADHGGLKRVIRPTRGFQTMRTASATIKGFEVMRMIRRRHCLLCKPKVAGEIQFINKLFDVAA
jgi:hypothetical protein